MRTLLCLTLAALLELMPGGAIVAQSTPAPKNSSDHEAVVAASFAYIDALYNVDSTLVIKAVHPTLSKRGYIRTDDGGWREGNMSYEDLLRLSARWNKSGKEAGPSSPRSVKVLEVLDHTAVTRVTAEWGTDFLNLAKYPEGWKIVSIVWQTPPRQ